MKEYTFQYRHGGIFWSLNYFANDEVDALKKLQSIKNNAEFIGEVYASIDIPFIERIVRWLQK